jgi:hypothetical protein
MTVRIPNTVTWHERLNYQPEEDWNRAKSEYIAQFPYQVVVRLGGTYTDQFAEFEQWCQEHLGTKFRDWFMMSKGKGLYTLYAKDTKWSMFLVLAHVDKIVN